MLVTFISLVFHTNTYNRGVGRTIDLPLSRHALSNLRASYLLQLIFYVITRYWQTVTVKQAQLFGQPTADWLRYP